MSWTKRPLTRPGRYPRGDELEVTFDQIESLTTPGWFDYSLVAPPGGLAFTLSAATTPPTQGNSTYVGRCRRPVDADRVDVEVVITIGSTFSAGSGVYRFGLPYAASALANGVGAGYILDNGSANRTGIVRLGASGGNYLQFYLNGALNAIDHSGSGTAWANGDIIQFSFSFEPA